MSTYTLDGSYAPYNPANYCAGNAAFAGYGTHRHAVKEFFFNAIELLGSYLRIPMRVASFAIFAPSTLSHFVGRIIGMGSNKKMCWIDTRRVITFVADAIFWRFPMSKKPRYAVRPRNLFIYAKNSVAPTVLRGSPLPAFAGGSDSDFLPESFLNWSKYSLGYNHQQRIAQEMAARNG